MPETFTRAVRFRVHFGLPKKEATMLMRQLRRASWDLTRAANIAMTATWLVREGQLAAPVKADGSPYSNQSLPYRVFAQSSPWEPFGCPVYVLSTPKDPKSENLPRRLVSGSLVVASNDIHSKISTKGKDIRSGKCSLPTFKELPLPVKADNITFIEEPGAQAPKIRIVLWGRGDGDTSLTVEPMLGGRRLDAQVDIIRKLASGEYKKGNATLGPDRNGKWMLSISWTAPKPTRSGRLIAGVDWGMVTTASVAYIDAETGSVLPSRGVYDIPSDTVRLWDRIRAERRARSRTLRKKVHEGPGHGRQRKLRALEPLAEKHRNLTKLTVREMAAHIVSDAMKAGAVAICTEDLKSLPETTMSRTEELSNRERARQRANFLRTQSYAVRAAIKNAAEREGLLVFSVAPAHTSRTCSACGTVWANPEKEGFGRVTRGEFRCSCGFKAHADRNAAINIARRGRDEMTQVRVAK